MNINYKLKKTLKFLKIIFMRKEQRLSTKNYKNRALTIFITFPVIFSSIYFYSIGRKRYFVRSDVIVRKATNNNTSSFDLSNIIGAGNQSSLEDSLFLQTYLESPQVLRYLEDNINFKEKFAKKGLDLYAGLSENANNDKKYKFFRKLISIGLNERSGILRIRSIAYDPETAYKLNLSLVEKAESFVNDLNQSIYKEQLVFLNNQVLENAKKLADANKKLSEFQQSYEILDAKSEAKLNTSFIAELESQLVKLKVELASIQRQFVDNNSPEIRILKDQIKELTDQISIERNLLVDPKGKNYSRKIIRMEQLKSNVKYISDLYLTSLKAAEKAKVDSVQQQRFLAIISEAQLPQQEWKYWRNRGFFTSIAIFFISVSLTKFLLGMADSHNN